ncbi:MAG: division/cell wall cluster transcriptional repressor MraZ [Deltaproteobacteria bacterium]|nr:division/cell wall cluster transcriptional repressor MraZ [bacterium]MCB9477915.1 division/cell wall cluster transcriptional repressor MraZ [Deltaproteobacteria bacterium]MCB9478726.1 division/cell wall cluster transcriptional repressor MraZ [Deltaproteobacteria bacterium]MCB9488242.1 division/cell wall cluster transcriptional repressor MraZ [Deltaproteobacteria bacterium]
MTMDAKGRVAIPAPLRDQMGEAVKEPLVVTTGKVSLDVYTQDEWRALEDRLDDLNPFDPDAELFRAYYVSGAQEVTLDKASRILIPATLRDEAGLDRDVLITGMGNKMQIFSMANWQQHVSERAKQRFDEISSKLASELSGKPRSS